jgi:hypothetical protein
MSPTTATSPVVSNLNNYYGLLETDCRWGIIQYGNEFRLVLIGHQDFIRRNRILFSSFGGSNAFEYVSPTVAVITSTEENMIKVFQAYLYGQLFREKAKVEIIKDKDGEMIDTKVLNDEELQTEAHSLATSFRNNLAPAYGHVAEYGTGNGMEVYNCSQVTVESND